MLLLVSFVSLCAALATPEQLVAQMTLDEKLSFVLGVKGPYVGQIPGLARLGIPALHLQDGPQGVGDGLHNVTAWPSALTVSSTWDTQLMREWGAAMAREQRGKGVNVGLLPMVNLARMPVDGRAFESLGEDPTLSSHMVAAEIAGFQSEGVVATVKHYLDNNEELNRTTTSAFVASHVQWELYLRPFRAAVKAGVGAFMCSYNRINDEYACENEVWLGVLKERIGFKGWVMSDWGATHSTVRAANNGLDQEMPGFDLKYFGAPLKAAVTEGLVTMSRLDDMVTRILRSTIEVGVMGGQFQYGEPGAVVTTAAHRALAQRISEDATVLLKNKDGLLPLSMDKPLSIAVIGDLGNASDVVEGRGSGSVQIDPKYLVTALEGIKRLVQGHSHIVVSYAPSTPLSRAQEVAAKAQVAVVVVGVESGEGHDRTTLSLGQANDDLVRTVAKANNHTIVVTHNPGAVLVPWISDVAALLAQTEPGQADGAAVANILFGVSEPCGRLPVTWPAFDNQQRFTEAQYPGINNQAIYSEGLYIGYPRYLDINAQPSFFFGFGLSYTRFFTSQFTAEWTGSEISVTFTAANEGARDGAFVGQVYMTMPAVYKSPRRLAGFQKAVVPAGKSLPFSISIDPQEFSLWSEESGDIIIPSGTFAIEVCESADPESWLFQTSVVVPPQQ